MKRALAAPTFVVCLLAAIPPRAAGQEPRLSPRLEAALERERPGASHLVWVFFRDKGPRPEARLAEGRLTVSPRALARRARRGRLGAEAALDDVPLARAYVEAVAGGVLRLRNESRWFNAASVEATAAQVRALARLPFVSRLDVVRRYRRSPEEPLTFAEDAASASASATSPRQPFDLNYGTSLFQLKQINVPSVHNMGFHGEGVVVAVFDTGFNNLGHQVFSILQVVARRDFVNDDDDVGDGPDMGEGSHGTNTLSVLGGFREGELIGPAYAASYILAKTENTDSETPVEEDNWAAAAEWAEGLGADVISSSLGYLTFDSPFTSYTPEDMDGDTAISTRAADRAADRGVVVVSSAGNSGLSTEHNTLGAPADGHRVLAVAAVTAAGQRAGFSSVGPSADGRVKPDVAAQGVMVKVASSTSADQYRLVNGTSFSCPLTAGVAALLLQAHANYSVDQVLAALRSTASQAASPNNLLGFGIVSAQAAIQAPAPAVP